MEKSQWPQQFLLFFYSFKKDINAELLWILYTLYFLGHWHNNKLLKAEYSEPELMLNLLHFKSIPYYVV